MVDKFSARIVSWQIARGILKQEDQELYQYAYELLINQVCNIAISIMIAFIFSAWIPVLAFSLVYMPLRSYAGGVHARTNELCLLVSVLVLLFICILSKAAVGINTRLSELITMILSGLVIYRLAPVEDVNRPFNAAEVKHFRKTARLIWIIEVGIWCITVWKYPQISLIIAMTHGIVAVALWLGLKKLKRLKSQLA